MPAQTGEGGRVVGEELRTLKGTKLHLRYKEALLHKGQNFVIAGLNTKAASVSSGFGSGVSPMAGNRVNV